MERAAIPEPPGFAELSKAEQVLKLQALWGCIAEQPGDLPVPGSHLEFAEVRLAEYLRDPRALTRPTKFLDRLAKKRR